MIQYKKYFPNYIIEGHYLGSGQDPIQLIYTDVYMVGDGYKFVGDNRPSTTTPYYHNSSIVKPGGADGSFWTWIFKTFPLDPYMANLLLEVD